MINSRAVYLSRAELYRALDCAYHLLAGLMFVVVNSVEGDWQDVVNWIEPRCRNIDQGYRMILVTYWAVSCNDGVKGDAEHCSFLASRASVVALLPLVALTTC